MVNRSRGFCYIGGKSESALIRSRIKELMEAKGFTYQMLEQATGLTNVTITRVRGKYISQAKLETLEVIAHALGVRVKDLFEEVGEDGRPPGE